MYARYESETERTYSADNPSDIIEYEFELICRNFDSYAENWAYWFNRAFEDATKQTPKSQRKKASRTSNSTRTRKGVRKQVLQRSSEKATNRHTYVGEQTGGWSQKSK